MKKNLIADAERNLFSERLAEAMLARGLSPSPSVLAREFNPRADGAGSSYHRAGTPAGALAEHFANLAVVWRRSAGRKRRGQRPGPIAHTGNSFIERFPFA